MFWTKTFWVTERRVDIPIYSSRNTAMGHREHGIMDEFGELHPVDLKALFLFFEVE